MKNLSILLLVICSFVCNTLLAEEIPNNEIWYEANAKLSQTTDYKSSGIYTSAFDLQIVSHTFSNGKGVIKFNEDVKKVGFAAFMNCSELTSITVPNSVVEYGYWVLNGCNKIKSIRISKSVKKIDSGAFSGCGGLENLVVETGNANFDSRNNCNAIIDTKTNTLIAGCKNTIIPNSVTSISSESFYGCYDLKNILIPNSVKSIGYNAFYGCTSLPIIENIRYADTNIIEVTDKTLSTYSIREGTRFIGHQAFKDCVNLVNIKIPSSVIRIESGAFDGCNSLPVVDNIRYADKYLVGVTNNKQSSYSIQDGTLVIGSRAFENCNITSMEIPNSVEVIDDQAFYMCHNLSDIKFSNSLQSIGNDAFNGCSFNSIRIPNTVTTIGSRAFAQCHRLTDIQISESVTTIGEGAFSSNESLASIVVDINNSIYDSRDNCNAIIETATNTLIAACKNTTIPKSVVAIGCDAYERRAELTSFTIPENITVIGDRAFGECWNIEEINIPNSVTSLGEGAFFFCSALKNIVIPNSVKGTINEIFCYCRELQSVTLSNSITYICGRAFTDCEKLTDIYCNALVPPIVEDDWAFKNVPSNMKVHVPAVSIDLYEKAPYWKNYEIVPIQNKNSIIVNLPDDATDGLYNNMTLELVDLDRKQVFKLIVKDDRTYSFNNLAENTKYKLSLKGKNNFEIIEYEEINYSSGNLIIDIQKEKMIQLCVVNAIILAPSNEDITSQCTINWYDNNDEFISQGHSVSEQLIGNKVKCVVSLPKELGAIYKFPEQLICDVKDANNVYSIKLEAIPYINITGKVVDDLTDIALSDVTVTVSQILNGKYPKIFSAKTDKDGMYNLKIYAVPSSISYAATDYINKVNEISEENINKTEIVLESVNLKQITGTTITTNFTYSKSVLNSEVAEVENYYKDYNNVEYFIFNRTANKSISQFSVQYPRIIIQEESNEGDILNIVVRSKTSSFNDITLDGVIGKNNNLCITIPIIQLGGICAQFDNSDNYKNVGLLYDRKGNLVRSESYNASKLSMSEIPDGEYRLVSMGGSNFFDSIISEDALLSTGLEEGRDYVVTPVIIKSGEIFNVSVPDIPEFDESRFYYTENTSFTVNKPTITVGNYLSLNGKVDFKKQFVNKVSCVKLLFELPGNCEFVENSVLVGASYGNYTIDGNKVIVDVDNITDHVRFCVIPTIDKELSLCAFVQFNLNGQTIVQPIGSANFIAKGFSISVPSTASKTNIPVSGTSIGNSTIEIYDGDVMVGQTSSLANGTWASTCSLNNPYNLSVHSIHAKAINNEGLELNSVTSLCQYNESCIQLKTVTMLFYNGWLKKQVHVLWDFVNNSTDASSYMFYHETDFTFILDFSENNPSKLSNVLLYVLTTDGKIRELYPTYDASIGKFIAVDRFSSTSLPKNVEVKYIDNSEGLLDSKNYSSIFNEYEEVINECKEVTQENEILTTELERNKFVDNIEEYLTSGTLDDYLSIIERFSNNSIEINDEVIRKTNLPEEDLLKEFQNDLETVENTVKNIGESIKLASAYLKDNPYYEHKSNLIKDKILVDKEISNCDGLNENDLLKEGYLLIPSTDNSRLYEYIDDKSYCLVDFEHNYCLKIKTDELQSNAKGNKSIAKNIMDFIVNNPDAVLSETAAASDLAFYAKAGKEGRETLKMLKDLEKIVLEDLKVYTEISQRIGLSKYKTDYIKGIKNQQEWLKAIETERANVLKGAKVTRWVLGIGSSLLSALMTRNKALDLYKETLRLSVPYCLYEKNPNTAALLESEITSVQNDIKDWAYLQFCRLSLWSISEAASGPGALAIIPIETWVENTRYQKKESDVKSELGRLEANIRYLEKKVCGKKSNSSISVGGFAPITPDINPIHDPSGFVYEGVPSNRIEGVTVTAYYKEFKEDMYGNLKENIIKWDAEEYGQKNPLFTDENGYYRWDVPQGLWQVKFEKEGYETTYSDWLPVPPPQLDVNISMSQNVQPKVKSVHAYGDAVVIEFDKYMLPSQLNDGSIVVVSDSKRVDGIIQFMNEETTNVGTRKSFVSKVRFNAKVPFDTNEINLMISKDVRSYAGIPMAEDYVKTLNIENEVSSIKCDSILEIEYGNSQKIKISVVSGAAAEGKILHIYNSSPIIMDIDTEAITLGSTGEVELTIYGNLPGMGLITYFIEDTDVSATTSVKIYRAEDKVVKTPGANIDTGSVVRNGTRVILTCDTENATLYYTIDGSCPCDETKRIKYEHPIEINNDITIKVIAISPNMVDSEIAEFKYITRSNVTIVDENGNQVRKNLKNGDELCISDDFKSLSITEDIENVNITYSRNFGITGVWQCWYEPFDIKVNSELFDAAELEGYTLTNGDEMIAFKLLSDETTMYANTPYLIRPKSLEFSLNLYNSYLSKTIENQYVYESDNYEYVVGGNYSPLQNSNIYILNDNGEFIKNNGNEILFGQRYWLSITPIIEDPDLQDVNAIKYVVLEENETTGINQIHPFEQSSAIYNTLGQRIISPLKGHIYISKGKSFFAK